MTDTPKLTDDQIRDMLDKATREPYCMECGRKQSSHPYRHPFRPSHLQPSYKTLTRLALERGAERDAARAEVERLRELLDSAANGLEWWKTEHTSDASEADEEMLSAIRAALSTQEGGE